MELKEEEIQNNTSQYNLIKVKSNKGVDAFIVDKEFYFRFELPAKNNIRICRCKEYRKASKCPTLFKIKDDNIIDKILFIIILVMQKNVLNIFLNLI